MDKLRGWRSGQGAGRLLCAIFMTCLSLLLGISASCAGEDWPQYRGSNRDGKTREPVATTWPSTQPKESWRANVGKGHSPVSVVRGKVITLGHADKDDTVWCLDAATGKELWRFDYPAMARMKDEPGNGAYDGPHAAPAIQDGKVYTLSRDGQVHCLDFATGKPIWSRNLAADQKADFPECGFAGSPLLYDNLVIVSVGPAGTALDAKTGQTKWDSGSKMAGYGAPTLVVAPDEQKRLLFFAAAELVAVNPSDGARLWSLPWPTKWGANVADPVAIGDAVFVSSAYDQGCALVELSSGVVRWRNKQLGAHASPLMLHEDYVFGFNGYIDSPVANQSLMCMDPLSGNVRWRKKGMGGQMILAGDKLVMLLVTGELVIVDTSSDKYVEMVRAKVQEREECPVPPTLVDGRLYCRTGKGVLRCLEVAP